MVNFIVRQIKSARDQGTLVSGRAKYETYFIRTSIYSRYREPVNTALTEIGYEDCIVE